MVRTRTDELLLGEWACLALLAQQPAHGYDIATRLAPAGDIGRVWSLSRPLTYRALDQLTQRALIVPVAEEKGKAGGNRTILAPTPQGRRLVRRWLDEPVPHFRAVRDELLLKLVLAQSLGVDRMKLLQSQRALFAADGRRTRSVGRKPKRDLRSGRGLALRVVALSAALHRSDDRGAAALSSHRVKSDLCRLDRRPHLHPGPKPEMIDRRRRHFGDERHLADEAHADTVREAVDIGDRDGPHVPRTSLRKRGIQGHRVRSDDREDRSVERVSRDDTSTGVASRSSLALRCRSGG